MNLGGPVSVVSKQIFQSPLGSGKAGACGRRGAVTAYPLRLARAGDRTGDGWKKPVAPQSGSWGGRSPMLERKLGSPRRVPKPHNEARERRVWVKVEGDRRRSGRVITEQPHGRGRVPRQVQRLEVAGSSPARAAVSCVSVLDIVLAHGALGPTGFDVESTGRRACKRRSYRFDQASNPSCERKRNSRCCVSISDVADARSSSSSAAQVHELADQAIPADGRRDVAGWWRRRPPGVTVSEASRTYLGQACARRRSERFTDPGSIPGGSTGRSANRMLTDHRRRRRSSPPLYGSADIFFDNGVAL